MKTDSKFFFNYAKKNKAINKSIGPLKNQSGELVNACSEMADILNKQYYSVFNKTSSYPYITSDNEQGGISLESFFTEDDGSVSEVNFSPEKVEKAIDAIKPTSAPGPDKLLPVFLKNTKHVISSFLADLMNESFENSEIPGQLIQSTIHSSYLQRWG